VRLFGFGGGRRQPDDTRPRRTFGSADPDPDLDLDEDFDDVGGVYAAPEAVGGDVILSGDGATADLSARAAERLSGRAIALAGVVVVAGVFLSRILGWVRIAVFGAEFGAGDELGAFFAAFRIPDALFQLVAAGAVGSALVPVASGLVAQEQSERARRVVSSIANLMVLALVPVGLVLYVTAPSVVPLIANPADPGQLDLVIGLTRLMLLSPVLLALGAVMSAGLNSVGIFGAPAMAPNVYNIAIIVCAVALTPFLGVYALALGVVLGAVGHVLTQASAVRSSRLYRPVLDWRDPAVRETLTLMAPRALGLGATQIVFLVNTFFATTLGLTALSYYTFAFTALQIPVGLIGVPLGIVLLPPLSQAIARGEDNRFRGLVDQSLRLLLFVVVPLTLLMLALGRPILALLYQYGRLDGAGVETMLPTFQIFLAGLIAHVLIALLAPIFYAGKDTRTPVTAALVAVAVDVMAAVVLFPLMHVAGLALAIGLGAWVEVGILVVLMERRIGFDLRPLARHSLAFVGGGTVAAAAAYLVARWIEQFTGGPGTLFGRVSELLPAGVVALVVYAAWARMLHLPELAASVELARTLLGRGLGRGRGGRPAGDEARN
jgi:putative peptidoglycan lipid II flippase